MSILVRIGERVYEFDSDKDVATARAMYAQFSGSQNEFEEAMDNEKIEFYLGEEY